MKNDDDISYTYREWIHNASYEDMLRRVRFAPLGDQIFMGCTGVYFRKVMATKRGTDAEHTATSKRIGWDR